MVGRYDLALVNTRGEYGDSVERGVLDLWLNDSTRRFAWVKPGLGHVPGERPLPGAFESQLPRGSGARDTRASRDPERPGVEVIGPLLFGGGPVLFMGSIDVMDASGERLRIRAVSPEGFWGTWGSELWDRCCRGHRYERVLANPAGHFCALRIRKS